MSGGGDHVREGGALIFVLVVCVLSTLYYGLPFFFSLTLLALLVR